MNLPTAFSVLHTDSVEVLERMNIFHVPAGG